MNRCLMRLAFRVVREQSVGSPNDSAKQGGLQGEPEGLVVISRTQTGGRGRSGNMWSSPTGGLYMSILLRPALRPNEVLRMSVFSCVPVGLAIEKLTGLRTGLKWPNDI